MEPILTVQADRIPRAYLAGVNTGKDRESYDATMKELEDLAKALGFEVAGILIQNTDTLTQRTYLGSGKVLELRDQVEREAADIVFFNEALSPMQVRNLEDLLDTEVMDRTGLILQIFSTRARTREAKLQVESARLQYLLPRLAHMRTGLSRQGGGSGRLSNKGAGEEQLELDRRHIEHRIADLRRQLEQMEKERGTQRARRLNSGLPLVALVGYTNAGKSTVLNRLLLQQENTRRGNSNAAEGARTGESAPEKLVFEKDMLFATLDTSVRRIEPDGMRPFLLSDTVGFIRDLPHALVKAFRSTLEEVRFADLLVEVVDCSDPSFQEHMAVTERTLSEIGAGEVPVLQVFNKCDLAGIPFPKETKDRVYVSMRPGTPGAEDSAADSCALLLGAIGRMLAGDGKERTFLIPYEKAGIYSRLTQKYTIRRTEYPADGIEVVIFCSDAEAAAIDALISRN